MGVNATIVQILIILHYGHLYISQIQTRIADQGFKTFGIFMGSFNVNVNVNTRQKEKNESSFGFLQVTEKQMEQNVR